MICDYLLFKNEPALTPFSSEQTYGKRATANKTWQTYSIWDENWIDCQC